MLKESRFRACWVGKSSDYPTPTERDSLEIKGSANSKGMFILLKSAVFTKNIEAKCVSSMIAWLNETKYSAMLQWDMS